MTFMELCKQITRECGQGVSYDQTTKIMITAWRIMLEELFIDPDKAVIQFTGIGKFYLKKKTINCGIIKNGEFMGHEKQKHYCFRFNPGVPLKRVMRGDMPLRDIKIGYMPLYFEKMELKRPKSDFKEGEKIYENFNRPNLKYDRAEIRMLKDQKTKRDIDKRLPEE